MIPLFDADGVLREHLAPPRAAIPRIVLLIKLPYDAKVGVAYHWLVDLEARAVTAQRLESGRWVTVGAYGDETEARIEPFDIVPIDVAVGGHLRAHRDSACSPRCVDDT